MGLWTMERLARAAGDRLFAAGARRRSLRQRSRAPGVREVCFPRALENLAATTARRCRSAHVGIRLDDVCNSSERRRVRATGGTSAERNRSDPVVVRVRDRYVRFIFARPYSRLSFAM